MRLFITLLVGICWLGSTLPAHADSATTRLDTGTLAEKYPRLKADLAASIFASPILLNSTIGKDFAHGEVYAILDTPFTTLQQTLATPRQWCELAILHVNIKTCTYQQDKIRFFVGRKHYEPPEQAHPVQYTFQTQASTAAHLQLRLNAADGPLGTSDYQIGLEAVPIDGQRSFVHFTYRYRFGLVARLAMQTYLSTLGRSKVGFTITGTDDKGEPIYIQGLQGVIERNVMRYIFAIQSVVEAAKSPQEYQHTAQLVRWYAHISKYPAQLVELSRDEYLRNKQHEIQNQAMLQSRLEAIPADH